MGIVQQSWGECIKVGGNATKLGMMQQSLGIMQQSINYNTNIIGWIRYEESRLSELSKRNRESVACSLLDKYDTIDQDSMFNNNPFLKF